jgi:hypothetical protein
VSDPAAAALGVAAPLLGVLLVFLYTRLFDAIDRRPKK